MKKITVSRFLLLMLSFWIAVSPNNQIKAQNCSEAGLFQKYWQYKNRFNKSFIVQDRDPSGCINDGIGFTAASSTSSCQFTKAGFGLPATHLMIAPNGVGIPGAAINQRFDTIISLFEDFDCPSGISWDTLDPNRKFNWTDYGSETLTQLGWQFVTLSTEYELLRRSGQTLEQQKVLEEIFLGIQAIRRLDMQAQCMIKEMYDDRSPGKKITCDTPYIDKRKLHIDCHRHWDTHVHSDCNFVPDFSGYNGFFLRCDAGQNLEQYLNDPTDQSWNVDAVGGAFSGLNSNPLDDCDDVDPFCWMVFTQHFMSQDQLINLFYGFTFIKKYIPEDATVTTCNGDTYKPLEMVQRLSESIVNKINDYGDHITLPGSSDCCGSIIKLSDCEGGNLRTTIYGLLKANEYITGKDTRTTLAQQFAFEVGAANWPTGLSFYFKESCMFKDLSKVAKSKRDKMTEIALDKNKEILLLGNDLLFPGGGESMADKIGGKVFFQKLLCMAPCEGPCHTNRGYSDNWPGPNPGDGWPQGFECPNVPGWEGTRWDGEGDEIVRGAPRRSNGLDYMALFNMYMLQYGTGNFYNPKNIQPSNRLTLYSDITGPDVLCMGETGWYEIGGLENDDKATDLIWTSSSNLPLSSATENQTSTSFNNAPSTGSLNAQFSVVHELSQFYYGLEDSLSVATVQDVCAYSAAKNIQLANAAQFSLDYQTEPCAWIFSVWANSSQGTGNATYSWQITHNDDFVSGTGGLLFVLDEFLNKYGARYQWEYDGQYIIELVVDNGCGQSQTMTQPIYLDQCGDGDGIQRSIRIDPNPAKSDIGVYLFSRTPGPDSFSETLVEMNKPDGYALSVKRSDGGPNVINTRVFSNGERINISALPNGYYNLQLEFSPSEVLARTFIIVR